MLRQLDTTTTILPMRRLSIKRGVEAPTSREVGGDVEALKTDNTKISGAGEARLVVDQEASWIGVDNGEEGFRGEGCGVKLIKGEDVEVLREVEAEDSLTQQDEEEDNLTQEEEEDNSTLEDVEEDNSTLGDRGSSRGDGAGAEEAGEV